MSIKSRQKTSQIIALEPEAAERIRGVIENYPISLGGCADILETVSPLVDLLTCEGTCNLLRAVVDIRCSDAAPGFIKIVKRLKEMS